MSRRARILIQVVVLVLRIYAMYGRTRGILAACILVIIGEIVALTALSALPSLGLIREFYVSCCTPN